MFTEISRFPSLESIAQHVSLISQELNRALVDRPDVKHALGMEMMMDFPSNQWTWDNGINTAAIGYDLREGGYSMLSIYKQGHELEEARTAFGETLKLLANVENLHYAAFSAMSPGAHLGRHVHTRNHLICHVLLNDLEGDAGCELICGESRKILRNSGDTALFDYTIPHETYNHSGSTRINLMIDFKPA